MKQRWWGLDPVGVLVGGIPLALSLTPSLLPRPAALQGLGSGVVFCIGYAGGLAISAVAGRTTTWRPSSAQRRRLRRVGWPTFAVVMAAAAVGGVASQNEVRRMVEMAPLDSVNVLGFGVALLGTSVTGIGLGRLIRGGWRRQLARMVRDGRSPARARRVATIRSTIGIALTVSLLAGIAYVALDRIYLGLNGQPTPGLAQPDGAYRSGGTGSEVVFTELGRTGANFVTSAPTPEEISTLTGKPAMTPIRVYVGIAAGGTLADRVATAVRELERTGAFDREVLVVAATTGTGWVEPQAVDAVEFLHSGNTATVALQYAHTPSFVTALTAPDKPDETSAALFSAVRAKWLTLPEDDRPQLVAYGLSLGAQATMNSFATLDGMLTRTEGVLLVGPTYATPLWHELQDSREPGSPPWQPVRDGGVQVRWASRFGDFERLPGDWRTPRVAILQHATDPITWLGVDLIWRRPEWLTEPNRAPDVSPSMQWIPLVTAVQVTLDMFVGTDVPPRHGHSFGDVMLEGWVAVTGDGGLDDAALARIQRVIESYAVIRPVQA